MDKFPPAADGFLSILDNHIQKVARKFRERGYHIAISYGSVCSNNDRSSLVLKYFPAMEQGKPIFFNVAISE